MPRTTTPPFKSITGNIFWAGIADPPQLSKFGRVFILTPLMNRTDPLVEIQARNPIESSRLPFFIGVDVGGTNIKIGLVDDLGQIVAKTSIKTQEERGPADAVARIANGIERLLA